MNENALIRILGNPINLQCFTTLRGNQGLFDCSLSTPNIDSEIHGGIADHALTLRQPMTASVRLTPELSQWIMRDMNPLFVTGIEAKNPIRLRIEPSRFLCPLDSFQIQQIQIGQGSIDMGQIRCTNGGSLASLIGLLKNSSLSSVQQMNVWFTPLYFSLQHGILQTSRIDALVADAVHICTWGSIDYIHDKIDMQIGLPADTLKHFFGIKKLPNDYVMKIHLTGSIKKPSLATNAAAAKIAALLGAQKSSHDWLTGGIFSLFGETDPNVPPPHRPFPWE
jgi:hypothetical protein